MKSKLCRTLFIAFFFVAILGFALREVWLTRETMTKLASALDRQNNLETESRNTKKLLAETALLNSSLNAKLAEFQAAKKRLISYSYDGDLKVLAEAAKPWRDIVLRSDAKLQAMYLQSERSAFPKRYASFVDSQGLSKDQAHRLEDAEMAKTERELDIMVSAQNQGLTESDPAIATLLNESNEELKSAVANLLGDNGYSQLQDYQRTLPTRDFVNTMAGALAFTDSPLSAQQANRLVEELSAANTSYQNGGSAISPRLQNYNELMATQSLAQEPVAWDSVQSQVQSLLNKTQFSLLDSMMQENSSTIQLYNMMEQSSDAPLLGFSYTRKMH